MQTVSLSDAQAAAGRQALQVWEINRATGRPYGGWTVNGYLPHGRQRRIHVLLDELIPADLMHSWRPVGETQPRLVSVRDIVWSIGMRETRWQPWLINPTARTGDYSWGPLQQNLLAYPLSQFVDLAGNPITQPRQLLDVEIAVKNAEWMSHGWTDFSSWAIGPDEAYRGANRSYMVEFAEWMRWAGKRYTDPRFSPLVRKPATANTAGRIIRQALRKGPYGGYRGGIVTKDKVIIGAQGLALLGRFQHDVVRPDDPNGLRGFPDTATLTALGRVAPGPYAFEVAA